MMDKQEESMRLTYKDTLHNQKLLREKLEILIKENRPLEEEEKNYYLEKLSKSLLGIGVNVTTYYNIEHGKIPLGKLHYFAEKMVYINTKTVNITYNGQKITIEIKELWKTLLDYVLKIYPHAQGKAIQISSERPKINRGEAYDLSKI